MPRAAAKLVATPLEPGPNKLGQSLGAKGARTRRRIMDATARLVAEHSFADVRITDVARAAEIAQPNFYTYFGSIEDVVQALGQEISLDGLAQHLSADWSGPDGLRLARRLMEEAFELWQKHAAVLSLFWFFADKRRGDFPRLRIQQTRSLYKAIEQQVRRSQDAGRISQALQPRLAGYECIALISSAAGKYELLRESGFSHKQLVETNARLLHLIATGIVMAAED
ncbi:MAG: regulatory protein TetR [Phenylobacterium sp.]|nr:regulatory protein TetR [Phenylobacterium sp.]